MATEHANLISVSGTREAAMSFLTAVYAAQIMTAETMSGPLNDRVSVDTGRVTIEAEFSTRGSAPFEAVAELVRSHPEVVVAVASVEPEQGLAAIHVLSGADSWIAELDEAEKAECAGEGGYLDEGAAFGALMSTAASVVDDYERRLQPAAAPTA